MNIPQVVNSTRMCLLKAVNALRCQQNPKLFHKINLKTVEQNHRTFGECRNDLASQ